MQPNIFLFSHALKNLKIQTDSYNMIIKGLNTNKIGKNYEIKNKNHIFNNIKI